MPDSNKSLILSLLKAELRNVKLINGLKAAGALMEDFNTDLANEIFMLIGFEDFERDDDLYDIYFNTLEKLSDQEISRFLEDLDKLAIELYNELLIEKIKNHKVGNMS